MNDANTLVVSGGGIKGFGLLGILCKLNVANNLNLDKILYYVGSSVGGLIVALLCFDYSPLDSFLLMCELLPLNYTREKDRMLERLKSIVGVTTFKELYDEKHVTLVLTSYDIMNRMPYYYSHVSHPDKLIFDALSETISIPFFMSTTDTYVDGCLCSPFPIKFCKRAGYSPLIGVYCFGSCQSVIPVRNPYDDYKIVAITLLNSNIQHELEATDSDDRVYEFAESIPFETFRVDLDMATDWFIKGYASLPYIK